MADAIAAEVGRLGCLTIQWNLRGLTIEFE